MIRSTISKIKSLRDVDTTGLADGDVLVWNASASKFEPSAGGGGGGGGGGFSPQSVTLNGSTSATGTPTSLTIGPGQTNPWTGSPTYSDKDDNEIDSVTWFSDTDLTITATGIYLYQITFSASATVGPAAIAITDLYDGVVGLYPGSPVTTDRVYSAFGYYQVAGVSPAVHIGIQRASASGSFASNSFQGNLLITKIA